MKRLALELLNPDGGSPILDGDGNPTGTTVPERRTVWLSTPTPAFYDLAEQQGAYSAPGMYGTIFAYLAALLTLAEPDGPDGDPAKVWTRKQAADLVPMDDGWLTNLDTIIDTLLKDALGAKVPNPEAGTTPPKTGTKRRSTRQPS